MIYYFYRERRFEGEFYRVYFVIGDKVRIFKDGKEITDILNNRFVNRLVAAITTESDWENKIMHACSEKLEVMNDN